MLEQPLAHVREVPAFQFNALYLVSPRISKQDLLQKWGREREEPQEETSAYPRRRTQSQLHHIHDVALNHNMSESVTEAEVDTIVSV